MKPTDEQLKRFVEEAPARRQARFKDLINNPKVQAFFRRWANKAKATAVDADDGAPHE